MMDKKVLVTGAAGFIGSNLCEELLALGCCVVGLDNFSTGKRENIAPFLSHPHFTWITGDMRDLSTCQKAVSGVDYVLHQAALGSVPRSIQDPITTHEVNLSGFLNLLVASADAGLKRLVYASSSSVYGDAPHLPKMESQTGKPLSPYAVTKYANECYAEAFHQVHGLDTIGLRYFNVFGHRQDPMGAYAAVIPKFVAAFKAHQSPVIYGDGSYSRDFTYVDNVVQANVLALTASRPEALNQVYNIAFGQQHSLLDLARHLQALLSHHDPSIGDLAVTHSDPRPGDIPHSLADISKARQLLGYHPKIDFATGLEKLVMTTWGPRQNASEAI